MLPVCYRRILFLSSAGCSFLDSLFFWQFHHRPVFRLARINRILVGLRIAVPLLALTYLSNGLFPALLNLIFALGILFPAASLIDHFGCGRALRPGLGVPLAFIFAILLSIPLFFIRKALPLPPLYFDITTLLGFCLAANRTQAGVQFLRKLCKAGIRESSWVLFFWLPIVFALVWTGFGARQHNAIKFYGLFPVDFYYLASVAADLNASPGLPLNPVADTGPLFYHWYFFTLPAWQSQSMGAKLTTSEALIFCNYLSACLLFLAIRETALPFSGSRQRSWQASVAASIIAFAPLISQAAQRWGLLLPGPRNQLVLSPINSMVAFGNNSLALAMILLGLLLIRRWRRQGSWKLLVPCGVFLAVMRGFSATLLVPLAGAFAMALGLAVLKRSRIGFAAYLIAGVASIAWLANCPSSGPDPRHVAFAFDSGRFLILELAGMLPLWALASIAITNRQHHQQGLRDYGLLLAACILVPTFFYVSQSPTGAVDLSMKIGSLAIVALTPMVALGLQAICDRWQSGTFRWQAFGCALLLGAALLQSIFYVAQFPLVRLGLISPRIELSLPLDYCKAMEFIRRSAPSEAVVIDPVALGRERNINPVLFLSERIPFLPQQQELDTLSNRFPELKTRGERWLAWQAGGFADPDLSSYFASKANYLVLKGQMPELPSWEPRFEAGAYRVYESKEGYKTKGRDGAAEETRDSSHRGK